MDAATKTALLQPGSVDAEPRRTIRAAIGTLSALDGLLIGGQRLPDAIHKEVVTWVEGMRFEADRLITLVEQHVPDHQRWPRSKRTA